MTVKELKEKLNEYPEDMYIVYDLYSDYSGLEAKDLRIIKGVYKDFYYMRSHSTMSEENKSKEMEYLCFPGN